jgi:hypothetical protein
MDWFNAVALSIVAASLATALVPLLDYWLRSRRRFTVRIGPAEIELSAGDVRKSLEKLEGAVHQVQRHPRVFLNYAAADREFAHRLLSDLERQGIPVWFDRREIVVGDKLPEKLSRGMEDSQWVATVLSPEAWKSNWFRTELKIALREESRRDRPLILPLLYKGSGLPPDLSDRVYADFRSDYDEGLTALVRAIRREPSNPTSEQFAAHGV